MRAPHSVRSLFALATLAVMFSACSPRLSPLYRDYTVPDTAPDNEEVLAKLTTALGDAGWQMAPETIDNMVRTEPRTLSRWGLYKVTVYLEAVPIGDDYARIYFHPYREYVTGGRSKIPYFQGRAQEQLLPDLTEALEAQGLRRAGAPPADRISAAR